MTDLSHKKVAILVADGFEQVELTKPRAALDEAGAKTVLISPNEDKVQGFQQIDKGDTFDVDQHLDDANPDDYNALLLPGGIVNPDLLRGNDKAIEFVRAFFKARKPVFAICHGPQVLITAEVVKGRKMTSYNTVRTDLINAGADWQDEEVVVDNGLVTSRNPDDIPAFNKKIIEELKEGKHEEQHA